MVKIVSWIVSAALLCGSCASNHSNYPETVQNGATRNVNNVALIDDESLKKGKAAQKLLKDLIFDSEREIGLSPMAGNGGADGFELRLWTSYGSLGGDTLLILRTSQGKDSGFVYRVQKPNQFQKDMLKSPQNGWSALKTEVTNLLDGKDSLIPDPNFDLGRDEAVNSVEISDQGNYYFAVYNQRSSFGAARQVVNLCHYLSTEFEVNLDCLGERTRFRSIR